jgi:hypothetical protein
VKRDPRRTAGKFITEAISEVFSGALAPGYGSDHKVSVKLAKEGYLIPRQ